MVVVVGLFDRQELLHQVSEVVLEPQQRHTESGNGRRFVSGRSHRLKGKARAGLWGLRCSESHLGTLLTSNGARRR
jgi:hypothetical protein